MKMRAMGILIILAAVVVAWGGCQVPSQKTETGPAEAETGREVMAVVDGVEISAAEVEEAAKGQLQKIRAQVYQVKKRTLDSMIEEVLLDQPSDGTLGCLGIDPPERLPSR